MEQVIITPPSSSKIPWNQHHREPVTDIIHLNSLQRTLQNSCAQHEKAVLNFSFYGRTINSTLTTSANVCLRPWLKK